MTWLPLFIGMSWHFWNIFKFVRLHTNHDIDRGMPNNNYSSPVFHILVSRNYYHGLLNEMCHYVNIRINIHVFTIFEVCLDTKYLKFFLNYRKIKMNCAISWIWNWFAGLALQVWLFLVYFWYKTFCTLAAQFHILSQKTNYKKFHCKEITEPFLL